MVERLRGKSDGDYLGDGNGDGDDDSDNEKKNVPEVILEQ